MVKSIPTSSEAFHTKPIVLTPITNAVLHPEHPDVTTAPNRTVNYPISDVINYNTLKTKHDSDYNTYLKQYNDTINQQQKIINDALARGLYDKASMNSAKANLLTLKNGLNDLNSQYAKGNSQLGVYKAQIDYITGGSGSHIESVLHPIGTTTWTVLGKTFNSQQDALNYAVSQQKYTVKYNDANGVSHIVAFNSPDQAANFIDRIRGVQPAQPTQNFQQWMIGMTQSPQLNSLLNKINSISAGLDQATIASKQHGEDALAGALYAENEAFKIGTGFLLGTLTMPKTVFTAITDPASVIKSMESDPIVTVASLGTLGLSLAGGLLLGDEVEVEAPKIDETTGEPELPDTYTKPVVGKTVYEEDLPPEPDVDWSAQGLSKGEGEFKGIGETSGENPSSSKIEYKEPPSVQDKSGIGKNPAQQIKTASPQASVDLKSYDEFIKENPIETWHNVKDISHGVTNVSKLPDVPNNPYIIEYMMQQLLEPQELQGENVIDISNVGTPRLLSLDEFNNYGLTAPLQFNVDTATSEANLGIFGLGALLRNVQNPIQIQSPSIALALKSIGVNISALDSLNDVKTQLLQNIKLSSLTDTALKVDSISATNLATAITTIQTPVQVVEQVPIQDVQTIQEVTPVQVTVQTPEPTTITLNKKPVDKNSRYFMDRPTSKMSVFEVVFSYHTQADVSKIVEAQTFRQALSATYYQRGLAVLPKSIQIIKVD